MIGSCVIKVVVCSATYLPAILSSATKMSMFGAVVSGRLVRTFIDTFMYVFQLQYL